MEVKTYVNPANKDERGVLVSCGYGAGWSTWNYDRRLAYDARVVEFWLDHKEASDEEVRAFCESLGYENVCPYGFRDIELEFVKAGVPFTIREYGGAECIVTGDALGIDMLS